MFFGSHLFLQRLRSIPPPLSSSYGSPTHTELRRLNPLWLHLNLKIPCFQIKPHSQVLRLGACVPLSWRHSSSCKVVSFVCVTLCMWQLILRLCRKATFRRGSTFCIPKPKRTSKKWYVFDINITPSLQPSKYGARDGEVAQYLLLDPENLCSTPSIHVMTHNPL